MPLTEAQRSTTAAFRAHISTASYPFGTAESVDQRARPPDPALVPKDVTVRVEIAPPSPQPFPLLDRSLLKTPERVPIYFHSLHSDKPESDVADTHVIFFIHGGGNITGHPTQDFFIQFYIQLLRTLATHAGKASNCVLVAPSYRLSTVPENTFPAALQDILSAYDYILSKGYKSSKLVVAGDSAGGGLAVVLTHLISQSNRPLPRGVIPIAPNTLPYDQLSDHARAQADTDMLTIPMLKVFSTSYIGNSGIAHTDPFISAAFLPFAPSWPKTLILVGTGDLLIDGSRELEKRLKALHLPVELVEYDEYPHGWWTLPQAFSEDIQDAAERVARFTLA